MKYKIYHLDGVININGKITSEFEESFEQLPEQIKVLFNTTGLTMIALQIDSGNGIVAAVYKKINE